MSNTTQNKNAIKIKKLADIIEIISTLVAIFGGFALFIAGLVTESVVDIVVGLLIIPVGILCAVLVSWILYGFSDLIIYTQSIALNTAKLLEIQNPKVDSQNTAAATSKNNAVQAKPRKTLVDLYREGLITEEEYNTALVKNSEQKE